MACLQCVSRIGGPRLPIASLPLDRFMASHYRPLVRFLQGRVGCEETAAELAQEACLRLARMADRGHIRDLSSYLFRTAENLAIDHLREMERSGTVARFSPETLEIADPAPSPEQRVADGERLAIVERAIAELDPLARKISILSRFQGHSHARIARELGISKSWVEKNIIRVLAHCKRRLREQDG